MKIKYLLPMATLTLMAGAAIAGLVQPAPVAVDLVEMVAAGDQWTARTADNDIDRIGCGIRRFDDGVSPPFHFGFCQAGDSDGNEIACTTLNANLLEAMHSINSFSFIVFRWQDDGAGGAECVFIGSSTQSFYLPDFTTNDADSDSDSD